MYENKETYANFTNSLYFNCTQTYVQKVMRWMEFIKTDYCVYMCSGIRINVLKRRHWLIVLSPSCQSMDLFSTTLIQAFRSHVIPSTLSQSLLLSTQAVNLDCNGNMNLLPSLSQQYFYRKGVRLNSLEFYVLTNYAWTHHTAAALLKEFIEWVVVM